MLLPSSTHAWPRRFFVRFAEARHVHLSVRRAVTCRQINPATETRGSLVRKTYSLRLVAPPDGPRFKTVNCGAASTPRGKVCIVKPLSRSPRGAIRVYGFWRPGFWFTRCAWAYGLGHIATSAEHGFQGRASSRAEKVCRACCNGIVSSRRVHAPDFISNTSHSRRHVRPGFKQNAVLSNHVGAQLR